METIMNQARQETRVRVGRATSAIAMTIASAALLAIGITDAFAAGRGGGGGGRSGGGGSRGSGQMAGSSVSGANRSMSGANRSTSGGGNYANTGAVNTGNANRGNVNSGNVNTGNVNRGNVNTGNINTGNINTGNVNIGNDVNINIDGGYHGGYYGGYHGGYYRPVATAAVIGAVAVTTAAVVGAYYYSLPYGCTVVYRVGVSYHYCGSVYYQQTWSGDKVVYVVVNP